MEARNFCIFPSLLLHAQARLKMTSTHLAVVMHLIDFWWNADRNPRPSKAKLSERLCLSSRHIQRQVAELEKVGLPRRNERHNAVKGKLSNEYDVQELFARAGLVDSVSVMRDQATGRARGFAFVEMTSDDEA